MSGEPIIGTPTETPPPQAATTSAGSTTAVSAGASTAPLSTPAEELIEVDQFFKVKLCVAQIESVEKIEKSKKLYKLQIDLGPTLGKRQIVSGIAQFYTPEQLLGRKIAVVANLKPATLMGTESRGMLLAASTADKAQLTLLTVSEDIPAGSFIS